MLRASEGVTRLVLCLRTSRLLGERVDTWLGSLSVDKQIDDSANAKRCIAAQVEMLCDYFCGYQEGRRFSKNEAVPSAASAC
jgi:hypothetical protein